MKRAALASFGGSGALIEIGALINDRYQVVSEIGQGGMGIVYCSHDTLLDRDVAIKVLIKSRLGAEAYQRLSYEAKAIARFNHPNIVAVYDAGEFRGSPFIVMELLEGELLSKNLPRPIDEVIFVGSQICAALDHAHSHGIVHRDLKPENVILLPDGTAKLMDFGVARSAASRFTMEGEILGTVFYLAPEQALGSEFDHRVDLYALGVILYELLTGGLPFVADDPLAVISQILNQPAPPPREKNAQIPSSLEYLVLRLLSKKKEERPYSAKDVLRELTRISEELGLLSPRLRQIADESALSKLTGDVEKRDSLPAFLMESIQSVEISRSPFVCRGPELERLERALEAMMSGLGGLRFIAGDAGKGKTSLVTEFARRAQDSHPDLIVAMGSCHAITGVGDPYSPFRNILCMLTGDVESQWAAGTLTRSHAIRLWDLLPIAAKVLVEWGPNLIGTFVPVQGLTNRIEHHQSIAIGIKHGIETTLTGRINLTGRGVPLPSRIFEEFTNVLQALAEKRPILLILEDLHWADASSLSLLFHLGRHVGRSKILILGTYRPQELFQDGEDKPPFLQEVLSEFKRDHGDIWIDLDRSDQQSARQFVDALLDVSPNRFDEGFRRKLTAVTEGHPLFTQELIKDLQERGEIFKETGSWVEGPKISWDILPAKVEGVIEKRIERLNKSLREVLAVASVEGEMFTAEVIAKVIHRDERDILRMLSGELGKKHRLTIEGPTRRIDSRRLSQYLFQHNLTQMYLYHNLGEARRVYLHEAVGTELERIYGEATEEVALQLSRHFQEAGINEKAVHYLYRAGVRALKLSAPREAVVHFSNGLNQLEANAGISSPKGSLVGKQYPGRLLHLKLERRLGEAYFGLGELSESLVHLQNLMRLLGKPVPSSQFPLFTGILWQILRQALHLVWPRPFPRRSLEGSPYLVESMRANYQLAEIYYFRNQPLLLIHTLLTTLNLAERLEPTSELSWAYAGMGNVAGLIPLHSFANLYIKRAQAIADDLNNPYDQAYVKLISSLYHSGVGNFSRAYEDLEKALDFYERVGDHFRIGEALILMAILAGYDGDLVRCKELFDKLFSMAVNRENELFKAWALVGLAELNLMSGEAESAIGKLEEALGLLKKNIDRSEEIRATGLLAKAYFIGGRHEKALEFADAGYQLITQSPLPTQFTMVLGYAGVAEAYVKLWEMQVEDPSIVDKSNSELRRSARQSCKTLHLFSRVFRIGLPHEHLWRGLYDWLSGNQTKAINRWVKGLAIAEQLKMPYVQGLLHFEIARHLEPENPERDHHIQAAEEIFSRRGAPYNLARVSDLIHLS
jgi:serine/threonine protein kinase/tetratricopeptide (TPR) repeat protein